MKFNFLGLLILFSTLIFAQDLTDFEQVDKFKMDGLLVKVYFKDPIKEIVKKYPKFDYKEDKEKHKILSGYLHNNSLYTFQILKKREIVKSYQLKGDPRKIKNRSYFNLDVFNNKTSLEKTIGKTNIGGYFFENMTFFQSVEGRQVIGKGIKIWGFFVMVHSYESIKQKVTKLIMLDHTNSLPEDYLLKEQLFIEPLFTYQSYGIENVKKRTLKTTVYQYDSLGNIKHESPRAETDTSLYLSSISKDLASVTSFPYFSKTDTIEQKGNVIYVKSRLENINHYLKDIRITQNTENKELLRIDGKLIIHGYNKDGHYSFDELFTIDFEKIDKHNLPKTVMFYPLDDKTLLRPRLITEIEYELK